MLRHVPGPEIERIDAETLAERVGREGGAARVRADQPYGPGRGDDAIGLPLPPQPGRIDHGGEPLGPQRDEANARLAGGRRRDEGRPVAADRLDVARKEGGGLAHIQRLGGADHDLGATPV